TRQISRKIILILHDVKSVIDKVSSDIPVLQVAAKQVGRTVPPFLKIFIETGKLTVFIGLHGNGNLRQGRITTKNTRVSNLGGSAGSIDICEQQPFLREFVKMWCCRFFSTDAPYSLGSPAFQYYEHHVGTFVFQYHAVMLN